MKNIYKYLCLGFILLILVFLYIRESKYNVTGPIPHSYLTEEEKQQSNIEILEENNQKLEEEKSSLQSKLEDLQEKYEYDEELIKLLQNQLEEHGIVPYEL